MREEIIDRHRDAVLQLQYEVDSGYESLFNLLDLNMKDEKLTLEDLPRLFDNQTSHFTHTDNIITVEEWKLSTQKIFKNICHSQYKIKKREKPKIEKTFF